MRWSFAAPFGGALALVVCTTALSTACDDDTVTTGYTPETGILVRSENLTDGIGCGTGDAELFKYVAIAVDLNGIAWAGGLYDCFADGVITNLAPAAGFDAAVSLTYTVYIYAYDQKAFNASSASIIAAVSASNAGAPFSTKPFTATTPTFTTMCTATQELNIQAVAVCGPLTQH